MQLPDRIVKALEFLVGKCDDFGFRMLIESVFNIV